MKEINYWQQFMNTGSVDDYLNYRRESSMADSISNVTSDKGASSTTRDLGVNSYAGVCRSNGNNFKDGACR